MRFEDWEEVRLGDVSSYRKDKVSFERLNVNNYISTDNLIVNKGGVTFSEYLPKKGNHNAFYKNDVLISNIRPYFKKIYFPKYNGACSNDILVFPIKNIELIEANFLYYQLSQDDFFNYMMSTANGTKMPRGNKTAILNFKFKLPPLKTQKKIAKILSNYDDLIENNLKQIKLLEEKARLTYEEWFLRFRIDGVKLEIDSESGLPFGWERISLSKIGNYLNGYAFKPKDLLDNGIPIIKIKEMKNGINKNTPRNYGENIDKKYLLKRGDIIFSWSASLEVIQYQYKIGWLNQHLFKVTANENIPKGFLYLALKDSLKFFDYLTTGATMKHIKRQELDFVKVILPTKIMMSKFNLIIEPLLNKRLVLTEENQNLKEARDILLPRLMTGIIEG